MEETASSSSVTAANLYSGCALRWKPAQNHGMDGTLIRRTHKSRKPTPAVEVERNSGVSDVLKTECKTVLSFHLFSPNVSGRKVFIFFNLESLGRKMNK
ncbi:hypothetical protein CEXT_93211 [Caerostris extrusa]|uniref:Uncharacterized protein n=1 Tax=Caerostris extrusa TaxID=172846 RepID=A0AAV4NXS8_CAEEX|nr:hypothetical protein CEXT_93211 [Caerostris extrusa]